MGATRLLSRSSELGKHEGLGFAGIRVQGEGVGHGYPRMF
jgi:hypothetical protein